MDFAYKVMKKFTGDINGKVKDFKYDDIVSFEDASKWKNLDKLISVGYLKQITIEKTSEKSKVF